MMVSRTASHNPPNALPWRYELGARVSWAEDPQEDYCIVRRRYDQGTVSAFIQYLLCPASEMVDARHGSWAYEPDILLWEGQL